MHSAQEEHVIRTQPLVKKPTETNKSNVPQPVCLPTESIRRHQISPTSQGPAMRLRKTLPTTMLVLLSASVVVACSVPVFRYALEHWRPDAYVATVFHNGLSDADQAVIKTMQPVNKHGHAAINLTVNLVGSSTC